VITISNGGNAAAVPLSAPHGYITINEVKTIFPAFPAGAPVVGAKAPLEVTPSRMRLVFCR
jgi:hypothetical protein